MRFSKISLLIIFILAFSNSAYAAPMRIFMPTPVNFDWQGNSFNFSGNIKVDNTADIKAALRDGTVMEVNLELKLNKIRTLLPAVEIDTASSVWHIKYENLTKEYILTNEQNTIYKNKNFDNFIGHCLENIHLEFTTSEIKTANNEYTLSISVSLKHSEIPPWIKKSMIYWYYEIATPTKLTLRFNTDENNNISQIRYE